MLPSEVAGALSAATRGPDDVEPTTRELLEFLQQATGLESTYLTVIHWEEAKQEILVSHNAGDLELTEGLLIEWADTLCRRALQGGPRMTDEVAAVYGDSTAARDLGLVSYASVPVTLADGSIYGTLCGAKGARAQFDETSLELFEAAAGIIAAQLDRERRGARERQRLLAAEKLFRAQALRLASIEHQMKTPLAVISGWAATLQDERLPDEARLAGNTAIGRHAERLRSLIDELLVAAREGHEPQLDRRTMDVAPLLRRLAEDLERSAPDRVWSVTLGDPLIVSVDPAALEQAVAHLVDNAVKYSTTGDRISIAAVQREQVVSIAVTDSGVGLPEDVSRLFEPFVRMAPERDDSVGLGLYIVRAIIEQHGGTVTASNVAEGGAQFELQLPSV